MYLRSGRMENIPYSLSRWTDVPAAKWPWFLSALDEGSMLAFDQRDIVPSRWSLRPEDVLCLLFWTKDPSTLLRDRKVLQPFNVQVHVTVTGWSEVEKGAPNLIEGAVLLQRTALAYGPHNVVWRFSPVPALPDEEVIDRFRRILAVAAPAGIREVMLSFLQPNDRVPETRNLADRMRLMHHLALLAEPHGVRVSLCNDDRSLPWHTWEDHPDNLGPGICVPPESFQGDCRTETCGCALMADPFALNESCVFGCTYCYASDQSLAVRKRNTTRHLPVVR